VLLDCQNVTKTCISSNNVLNCRQKCRYCHGHDVSVGTLRSVKQNLSTTLTRCRITGGSFVLICDSHVHLYVSTEQSTERKKIMQSDM
jgi:hypothetical protein